MQALRTKSAMETLIEMGAAFTNVDAGDVQ